MVHAEAYFLWNAAMCLCALPLGGRLAGLPAPGRGALAASAGLGRGAGAVRAGAAAPANPGAGRPALCGGAVLHARAGPCLRGCVSTLGASLMLGGGAQALVARSVPAPLALMVGAGVALLVYLLATFCPMPCAMCGRWSSGWTETP